MTADSTMIKIDEETIKKDLDLSKLYLKTKMDIPKMDLNLHTSNKMVLQEINLIQV